MPHHAYMTLTGTLRKAIIGLENDDQLDRTKIVQFRAIRFNSKLYGYKNILGYNVSLEMT